MKRYWLAILSVVAGTSAIPSYAAPPPRPAPTSVHRSIFPFPTHRTDLANGLAVISVEYDSPGIISYYTVVRTGSRNEVEPGLSGFAHFFEHMMFRGTERFSEDAYNDVLKSLGADSNAFTTDDWTCYHVTASADALETILDLEADRFQNLKYDQPGFQKEARAVLGEYNKGASSPLQLLDETLQDTAFTRHTYKHTTIGFLKDIRDMPNQFEYSRKFFDRWYRPENCLVVVVGDVNHNRLVSLARKYYGRWKRGSFKIAIPPEPPQTAEKQVALTWPSATLAHLYIGYHVPAFDPKSRELAAIELLEQAAFSESSPLYRKLVLEDQTVETLEAGANAHRDPTLFTIFCRIRSDKAIDAVRDEVFRTLTEAAAKPLSADRLADVKSHLRYAFAMRLSTTDNVARTVGSFLELTGMTDSIDQLFSTYETITPADIQAAARKYFVPANRTVVTLVAAKPMAAAEPPSAKPASRIAASEPLHQSHPASAASNAAQLVDAGCGGSAPQPVDIRSTVMLRPTSPLVALRILFRVGSQNDPPGKEGLAALTAAMLAEGGSKRLSYNEVLEKLYPMAADISADTDKEVTTFTGNVHRDKLAEYYAIVSEMLLAPRFDPADFERLREEHANYLSKTLRGSDDEDLGKWTLQLALYPGHPYGHVDAGTVAGLKLITLDDVKRFYHTYYTAPAVWIGVAGGADDAFVAKVKSDFSALPAAGDASSDVHLPEPPRPHDLELTIVKKDAIATAVSIGCPIRLTRADDDFYALAVANSYLGEHRTFNGRLMQNMRGKRGLNYGDYSYIENFIQDGEGTFPLPNIPRRRQHFSIWIRPVPHDKALFALRQAIRELDTLVERGISQEDFQSTRKFLLNYSKLWVQTLSRRLGYKMDGAFYGRDDLVAELGRRLPTMTVAEVNAAVKKHLQSKNLAVAVVTRDADAFRDGVLSAKPSPLVYDTQGTPADILAEDKLIESWPLTINRAKLRIVPVGEMFEH